MLKLKNKKTDSEKFWCKVCGAPDIRGFYRFTGHGVCRVTSVETDGTPYDYEDYDDETQDDWEINGVECETCHHHGNPENVITTNVNEVKDKKHFKWE